MNYLDIVLGLPLLWGLYRGFIKGLIISAASLAALILGVYSAIHFSSFFAGYITSWFHPDPKHIKVLSFAVTFIVVVIAVRLIGWGLDKLIKAVAMGFLNRFLGVLFNTLKWAFILSVLISLVDSYERTKTLIGESVKEESILYRPVSRIAPFVFPYLKFEGFIKKPEIPEEEPEQGKEI
jgi:membrane protein required for colicin V production